MRDQKALGKVLDGIDVAFHLVAVVGVGQSMYETKRCGEGQYLCSEHSEAHPRLRSEEQPLYPTNIHAITMRDQEEVCLTVGRTYGIPWWFYDPPTSTACAKH